MTHCPNCRGSCPPGAIHCPSCGSFVAPARRRPPSPGCLAAFFFGFLLGYPLLVAVAAGALHGLGGGTDGATVLFLGAPLLGLVAPVVWLVRRRSRSWLQYLVMGLLGLMSSITS